MDNCVRFTKDHIPAINSWYGLRAMPSVPENLFPDIGFIVPGIGCGFLYKTDSALCFLDGYMANPNTTKEERKDAFYAITRYLMRDAKDHGFTQILAYTKHQRRR